MTNYKVRYVHKIAPSAKDVGPDVSLPDSALEDGRELGRLLREAGVLGQGERASSYRVTVSRSATDGVRDPGGQIVVFPSGRTTPWHSVVLTAVPPETP